MSAERLGDQRAGGEQGGQQPSNRTINSIFGHGYGEDLEALSFCEPTFSFIKPAHDQTQRQRGCKAIGVPQHLAQLSGLFKEDEAMRIRTGKGPDLGDTPSHLVEAIDLEASLQGVSDSPLQKWYVQQGELEEAAVLIQSHARRRQNMLASKRSQQLPLAGNGTSTPKESQVGTTVAQTNQTPPNPPPARPIEISPMMCPETVKWLGMLGKQLLKTGDKVQVHQRGHETRAVWGDIFSESKSDNGDANGDGNGDSTGGAGDNKDVAGLLFVWATVLRDNGNNTFHVVFDNGSEWRDAPARHLRMRLSGDASGGDADCPQSEGGGDAGSGAMSTGVRERVAEEAKFRQQQVEAEEAVERAYEQEQVVSEIS
jgi:hypothetical protein